MAQHRGFEPEDLDRLQSALRWIAGLADRDCCCRECGHHKTNDPCEICQARHAADLIGKVLDPALEGLHPNRMRNCPERIYVQYWREQCERKPGLNSGFGLLEWILCPSETKVPPLVTQRDAVVATTVIQWLGTNCGRCFIDEAERRIKQEGGLRSEFTVANPLSQSPDGYRERIENSKLAKVADSVAADYLSLDKHPDAIRCLSRAIVEVALQYHKAELRKLLTKEGGVPA